jgi:translation initiation factor IF-3
MCCCLQVLLLLILVVQHVSSSTRRLQYQLQPRGIRVKSQTVCRGGNVPGVPSCVRPFRPLQLVARSCRALQLQSRRRRLLGRQMSAHGVTAWRRAVAAAWRRAGTGDARVRMFLRAINGSSRHAGVERVAERQDILYAGSLARSATVVSWPGSSPASIRLQASGTNRFFARPARDQGGGERKNRGDEPSMIVTNVAKGEKLKIRDMLAIRDKLALYIREDGSKEEMTVQQVLDEAKQQDLDPVLVSGLNGGDGNLVMKLMDVGKTRHEMQKKKRDSAKKNTGSHSLKELRFGMNIDQNDLKTKMKQACSFLDKGHRVKIFMQLKGADYHRNQAQALIKLGEIADLIGESGAQEGKPQISGHVVSTTLVPKPAGASKKEARERVKEDQPIQDAADLPSTPQDVEKQGNKVRAMKEAIQADPGAHSKSEMDEEIEILKTIKARLAPA